MITALKQVNYLKFGSGLRMIFLFYLYKNDYTNRYRR